MSNEQLATPDEKQEKLRAGMRHKTERKIHESIAPNNTNLFV